MRGVEEERRVGVAFTQALRGIRERRRRRKMSEDEASRKRRGKEEEGAKGVEGIKWLEYFEVRYSDLSIRFA